MPYLEFTIFTYDLTSDDAMTTIDATELLIAAPH
jgi:hypothetical protein